MKCPYCGGEADSKVCPFCNSNLEDLMPKDMRDKIDDEEDDEDDDDEITDEMIDEIRQLCRDFQEKHPDEFSCYEKDGDDDVLAAGKGVKDKLFEVLDIDEDDEILLIHDDTLLHSGKNGFAITDYSFYCLENGEDLEVTDFEDVDEDDEFSYDNTTVYFDDDETSVAYYTGDDKVRKDLCDLYNAILDVLFDDEED